MDSTAPGFIPQLKPSLRAQAIAPDLLMIISERQRVMIRGAVIVQVVQLIDGIRSAQEIIQALAATQSATAVLTTLKQLAAAGHLRTPDGNRDSHPAAAVAFWELMRADGQSALSRLAESSVSIEAIGGLDSGRLAQSLAASGIKVQEGGRLHIVLTDDYLRPELAAISARAAADHRPLLLVKPVGLMPSLGPLIDAQTGTCLTCLTCLQYWVRTNHPVENLITRLHDGAICHLPLALGAAGEQVLVGMVAAAVAALFALQEERIGLKNHLVVLNLESMESKRHAVVRRPQCPACGEPRLMQQQAQTCPQLQSVTQLHCKDGGYRRCDPLQTIAQYQHLVSNVCGPIGFLHPMPRRHAGMRKVYAAGYLSCPQELPTGNSFDKLCAGKGQTDEQARASALCEALERFSSGYQGDEACVRGSMASLREMGEMGERALDFNALQNFSDWQYENRDHINRQTNDPRKQVPQRFDQDSIIDWTPAWSLASKTKYYVPLTYCFAEAPLASGARYGIYNPNGTAAGNGLEEAILQGLLELVERDATSIWWHNQLPMPGIDLASFTDPYFDRLMREYADLGWDLRVLDLTHDLGIAACVAIAHHAGDDRYAIGFGCHLNAQLAVQRALTEVNQSFDPTGDWRAPWEHAALKSTQFLFPATQRKARCASDMPSVGGVDLKTDVEHCMSLLRERGMDMLVVNKTRPDIGLCVVQVIVPGLRHFWPRFGAGRLYSVPPAMGWLAQETSETALNPTPLFL